MEATVEKLEAMFLKSEADLEVMEKRVKLDLITKAEPNGRPAEENPAAMLETLRAVRAKHTWLCAQVREMGAEQQDIMDSIRNTVDHVLEQIQHLHQSTGAQAEPKTGSVHEAAALLGLMFTLEVRPPGDGAAVQ
ncbi:spindle and kinetochore-associated protein 2 [Antennarius striatus]|uniref:spindle and kinetochore-associated protein 2 n=1 Tax=Antennarius striatus TaxID=241820 RepID=UPI0035AFB4D9